MLDFFPLLIKKQTKHVAVLNIEIQKVIALIQAVHTGV